MPLFNPDVKSVGTIRDAPKQRRTNDETCMKKCDGPIGREVVVHRGAMELDVSRFWLERRLGISDSRLGFRNDTNRNRGNLA